MLSGMQIANMRREAALRAQRSKRQPFVPREEAMVENPQHYGRGIPNFGDYRPDGWKLREELFVDTTGWGDESEPAMTQAKFQAYMREHLTERLGYALIEVGQFQAYVGVFERLPETPEPRRPRRKPVAIEPISVNFSMRMGEVPSGDPIAFTYGFTQGYSGRERAHGDLAPAYKEGFALGREVRLGKRTMPPWAKPLPPGGAS